MPSVKSGTKKGQKFAKSGSKKLTVPQSRHGLMR